MTIRPSASGNFRPIDHSEPALKPLPPADLARAEASVRVIGGRLGETPEAVHDVLVALGLRDHGGRGWRCAGCDRPMARIARPGVVAHNAHGMCRRCCQLEVPA